MANCETFNVLKRSGATHRIGCPQIQTCDGSTCVLREAREAVETLSPAGETPEDNAQGRALAEALKNYVKVA